MENEEKKKELTAKALCLMFCVEPINSAIELILRIVPEENSEDEKETLHVLRGLVAVKAVLEEELEVSKETKSND